MTPSNAIFRGLFAGCQKIKDVKTFDYLPDGTASYPFIYVGEASTVSRINADVMGEVRQTIHVYAKRTQRNKVDGVVAALHDVALSMTDTLDYHTALSSYNEQTLPDNTDVTPLLHAVIDITYRYTKKDN